MEKKIETVIFDIGGVLVDLGRFRFLEKKGFTGERANRVMYATMRSKDWVQLDPERCVFIDDLEANLEGARAAGMHTILFENPAQAEAELDQMLQ